MYEVIFHVYGEDVNTIKNQFCITQLIDAVRCQLRTIRLFQRYQTQILKCIKKVKNPTKDSAERQQSQTVVTAQI
jgi:hypothetical protein